VAVEVGLLVGEGDDQHRRPGDPGPAGAGRVGAGERSRPEPAGLVSALEDKEGPALAEAGRRGAGRVRQDPVQHLGRDRAVLEGPYHAPPPHHLLEVHQAEASGARPWPGGNADSAGRVSRSMATSRELLATI